MGTGMERINDNGKKKEGSNYSLLLLQLLEDSTVSLSDIKEMASDKESREKLYLSYDA
jgi:hypothetical protein